MFSSKCNIFIPADRQNRVCLRYLLYSLTMEDLVATPSQSTPNPNGGYGNDKEADAKRAQEEQMRRDLLTTVLDTAARERCIYAPAFLVPSF